MKSNNWDFSVEFRDNGLFMGLCDKHQLKIAT